MEGKFSKGPTQFSFFLCTGFTNVNNFSLHSHFPCTFFSPVRAVSINSALFLQSPSATRHFTAESRLLLLGKSSQMLYCIRIRTRQGLYLTAYPESSPNTDIISF